MNRSLVTRCLLATLTLTGFGAVAVPSLESEPQLLVMQAASAQDAQLVGNGTFSGRSRHVTTGGVAVYRTDSGFVVVLGEDFSFDGAPDPKLGFGNNGRYDTSTTFAPLRSNRGLQNYEVPAGINAGSYNEVWIWCERFGVPLGVARVQ